MSSSIKSEKIGQFELGPFWEDHREMLAKLVKTDMPSKSRMHYTEVVVDRHPETNNQMLRRQMDVLQIVLLYTALISYLLQ